MLCECGCREHYARHMCRTCYNAWYTTTHSKKRFLVRAEIVPAYACGHPDRRALTKGKFIGMCEPCSTKTYRMARKAAGRPYTRRSLGTCPCGSPAVHGARTGRLRCRRCYDNSRWPRVKELRAAALRRKE